MLKTVLITGTSSGFGKLTTITLASHDHSVIAGMRDIKGKNAAAAAELNAVPNVEVVEMDVTSEESVKQAVDYTLKKYGVIDVLVNNAGVAGFGLFEATSVPTMQRLFEVNVFGLARTYQAVLPSMRKRKSGLIINISSGLGIFSTPFVVPYNATKFAVEAITEGIRSELKGFNIETVTVLPGPFPTDISSKQGFGPDKSEIVESYGPETQTAFEIFGSTMFEKMQEYKSDPQAVADGILKLIDMESGTRPFQTAINPIAEEIEQAFADTKIPVKIKWMEKMGWGAY